MAKNIEVKCNFASVFAKYSTVEELKALANNICGQVKTAYDARVKEITSGQTGVVVEVKAVSEPAPKEQKDKTAKAKEIADKLKGKSEAAKPIAKTKNSDDDTFIAITDTKAIKALGLSFEKYNDRCWVLRGNTKPLRKILKDQFKGVFNSHLTGGEGWVIKTANVEECAKALGLKAKVA